MQPRFEEKVHLSLSPDHFLRGGISFTGEPGPAGVLYLHGLGSFRDGEKALALEAECRRRGWTFASFNFRCHGAGDERSSGTMRELRCSRLLEDLDAIQEYLIRRGIRHILPVGSSMGGWAALALTARHSDMVPACTVLAPALKFPHGLWTLITEEQRQLWRATGRLKLVTDELDVELEIGLIDEAEPGLMDLWLAGWHTPLLLFHGYRDPIVPYAHSLEILKRVPGQQVELRLLKDGDHRLTAHKDEIARATCDFFAPWMLSPSKRGSA